MSLPLPEPIAHFLGFSGAAPQSLTNRSLLFDRGMDRYGPDHKIPPEGREGFLSDFTQAFQERPHVDFPEVLRRREQALQALGARSVQRIARTRLVVGLGLPHPTETGFLFDRITGCPYLPGSSVKGLLRAAARLAAACELPIAGDPWTEEDVRRIFGPELGGGFTPQTGSVVFYDAFPTEWPRLEVDILTPHHRDHNDKKGPPADWDEPNPVPFLTVAPGIAFCFSMGPGEHTTFENDFSRLAMLLDVALDLLAIGAKKSAGYGVFGKEAPVVPARIPTGTPARPERELPPLPPPPPIQELVWKDVELGWFNRAPAAFRGNQTATCAQDLLDPALLKDLKMHNRRGDLRGDVVVVKISGGFRLDRVQSWRKR